MRGVVRGSADVLKIVSAIRATYQPATTTAARIVDIISLTTAAQFALQRIGHLSRLAALETRDQTGELQQIADAEVRARPAEDYLDIWRSEVGPLRGNGAERRGIDLEQESPAVAVEPLAHTNEHPTCERMEWVGDADKTCRRAGDPCFLN